jgi:hypothetical protein
LGAEGAREGPQREASGDQRHETTRQTLDWTTHEIVPHPILDNGSESVKEHG